MSSTMPTPTASSVRSPRRFGLVSSPSPFAALERRARHQEEDHDRADEIEHIAQGDHATAHAHIVRLNADGFHRTLQGPEHIEAGYQVLERGRGEKQRNTAMRKATIWLSVSAEANTPMEASRPRGRGDQVDPRMPPVSTLPCGAGAGRNTVPVDEGWQEGDTNSKTAASNFANTTCHSVSGLVSRNSIVPVRRSSLMLRMGTAERQENRTHGPNQKKSLKVRIAAVEDVVREHPQKRPVKKQEHRDNDVADERSEETAEFFEDER